MPRIESREGVGTQLRSQILAVRQQSAAANVSVASASRLTRETTDALQNDITDINDNLPTSGFSPPVDGGRPSRDVFGLAPINGGRPKDR